MIEEIRRLYVSLVCTKYLYPKDCFFWFLTVSKVGNFFGETEEITTMSNVHKNNTVFTHDKTFFAKKEIGNSVLSQDFSG